MMKNFLTFRQLDTAALSGAHLVEDSIDPGTRQLIINTKLMKLYGLLDGLQDPWYNRSTAVTVAADQEILWAGSIDSGGVISAIDATLKTISRASGAFAAGSVFAWTAWDTAAPTSAGKFVGRFTTGGATATFEILSGSATTIADFSGTKRAFLTILKTLSVLTFDVSGLYLKDIVAVYDVEGPNGRTRTFDEFKDSKAFLLSDSHPTKRTRVNFYLLADTLHFRLGDKADPIGSAFMEYRGKPALFTDATIANSVDIPPERNEMLLADVVAGFLQEHSDPVPPELQAKLDRYKEQFDAAGADDAKQASTRK